MVIMVMASISIYYISVPSYMSLIFFLPQSQAREMIDAVGMKHNEPHLYQC
jgi:hypothetical protein